MQETQMRSFYRKNIYIYIDRGRDDHLSCDDEDWKFNQWLESYYTLVSEERVNLKFSAKIEDYR